MSTAAALPTRLRDYTRLMRIDRPIGALLLLWPTLWALWLAAGGVPDPWVLFVFIAGVWLMRSAGCVINDFADREFDPHVRRTRDRPIAAGRVMPAEALGLFVALCLIALALVLTLNWLTIALAVPAAALAAIYPFTKRYTHLPQVVLGAAFSMAIPMAYAAVTGMVPLEAWALFLANLCWTVAYDTIYGMVDREDDLRIGVKSTAILFGRADRLAVALFQGLFLLLMVIIGVRAGLGVFYFAGLLAAAGLFVHQHWQIRQRDPQRCFETFLANNRVGLVVFAGLAVDLSLLG